jgi:hypothetical protein
MISVRRKHASDAHAWLTVLVIVAFMIPLAFAAPPRPGYTKVVIPKPDPLSRPDASVTPQILVGLDAKVVQEYEASSLVEVVASAVESLLTRARTTAAGAEARDDFDKLFVGGHILDARLGLEKSVPDAKLSQPYPKGVSGAYLIQFAGPVLEAWVNGVKGAGAVIVQDVPLNGLIVAATPAAMEQVAALPYIQFSLQLHSFLKQATVDRVSPKSRVMWLDLADSPDAKETIVAVQRLSDTELVVVNIPPSRFRVSGAFSPKAFDELIELPLVLGIADAPQFRFSDERVAISTTNYVDTLTGLPTHPKGYKKWLADTCAYCINLAGEAFKLAIFDTGVDGGSMAAAGTDGPPVRGNGHLNPNATGSHRPELPAARLEYGVLVGSDPDTTGTLHDVYGHGTMVAGVAAADPQANGLTDDGGFYWGAGIAPSAKVVVTKFSAADPPTTSNLATAVSDAINHGAFIQNHSYNQYNQGTPGGGPCAGTFFNGLYSGVSADFDDQVRTRGITLTVSAGNSWEQHCDTNPTNSRTLPPATAKNVISVGSSESRRSVAEEVTYACDEHGRSGGFRNRAFGSLAGTAVTQWIKPDLMAPGALAASLVSYDETSAGFGCATKISPEYDIEGGTSFSAPVAAGAALLASRYYSNWHSTGLKGSPALLKAMLVAGAESMAGGYDMSSLIHWRSNLGNVFPGTYYSPSTPNGYRYTPQAIQTVGTLEPTNWPSSGCITEPTHAPGSGYVTWCYAGPVDQIGPIPDSRQGFGRISLKDVLSAYPSRDLFDQGYALVNSQSAPWSRAYKVHDPALPVRVVLTWTDTPSLADNPASPSSGPRINNDLDLSVEVGAGTCTKQFIGNNMTIPNPATGEESIAYPSCNASGWDRYNNIEEIRFLPQQGQPDFSVKVAKATGTTSQTFAIVVYNAYVASGTAPPLVIPTLSNAGATATQVTLSWTADPGAGPTAQYELQRSDGILLPFQPLATLTSTSYPDTPLAPGTTHLYRVRTKNATGYSPFSNVEPGTTVAWTQPLSKVKADHFTELLTAVNAIRTTAGLGSVSFPGPIGPLIKVQRDHLILLRTALSQARAALALPPISFTDDPISTMHLTRIKAVHIQELRNGTQ